MSPKISAIILFTLRSLLSSCSAQGFNKPLCNYLPYNESELVGTPAQNIAGSPPRLLKLAETDELIYLLVRDYIIDVHSAQESIEACLAEAAYRYLNHFEFTTAIIPNTFQESDQPVPYRPSNVIWNPLGVYHLINRFRTLLSQLLLRLQPLNGKQWTLRRAVVSVVQDGGWPTQEDLRMAMSAILRIQHVYDLSASDISVGILDDEDTGMSLSAWDCNEIGKQALRDEKNALAVEWFENSLEKLRERDFFEEIMPFSEALAANNIELSSVVHDKVFEASESWESGVFMEKLTVEPVDRLRRRTHLEGVFGGRRQENLVEINYWGLCSGAQYMTEAEKAKLFCYYETKSNPYWTVNPLKVEFLALYPLPIIQYHNLIGDKMIQKIKDTAKFELAHSFIWRGKEQILSTKARTSLNTWIDDHHLDEFKTIPQTVEMITGLKVLPQTSSEKLQVACYSAGSHYTVHPDARGLDEIEKMNIPSETGDRLATFLFYLSDVIKGGGTAFPQVGVVSSPLRGSAVMWFNLKKSAQRDTDTWHGSCPVIIGEKWITNKWVHTHDQMFIPEYKCDKDPEAKFELLVNGRRISEFY